MYCMYECNNSNYFLSLSHSPSLPSDLSPNQSQVNSTKQLETLSRLQLYEYEYREGVLGEMRGRDGHESDMRRVGVLAQELRQVLPDAVHETVSLTPVP